MRLGHALSRWILAVLDALRPLIDTGSMNEEQAFESLEKAVNQLLENCDGRDFQIRAIGSSYADALLAKHEALYGDERVAAVRKRLFVDVQQLAIGICRQRVAPSPNGIAGLSAAMLIIGHAHWQGASLWQAIWRERGSDQLSGVALARLLHEASVLLDGMQQ